MIARAGDRRWVAVALVAALTIAAGCTPTRSGAEPSSTSSLAGAWATTVPDAVPVAAAGPPRAWRALDPADRPVRLTLVVGGDLLVHRAVWESAASHAGGDAFDFGPMFDPVAPVVAGADLSLCHLESPLSADGTALSSYPSFNAPFELADAIAAAGFDGCSVASNHTLDMGTAGIDATLGHLDRVGVGHAGAARSAEEAQATRTYEVRGRRVAHLSYSYGFNGHVVPAGEPWRTNLIDAERIRQDAARARREGADLVVVSLHFGTEYDQAPSRDQRGVAAAVTADSEVDLVVGHHAHVVQPVARVNDTIVVYGLGNLLSNMLQPLRRDGVLVQVTVDLEPGEEPAVVAVDALPTEVATTDGHRIVPASAESRQRTLEVLNAEGVVVGPLEIPASHP